MEQTHQLPDLVQVIRKVKQHADLTAEEELIYLIYIERLTPAEAQYLINQWYNTTDLKTMNT